MTSKTEKRRGLARTAFRGIAAAAAIAGGLTAAATAPAGAQESRNAAAPQTTAPVAFTLPARPPKGAVVLFGGKADDLKANWYRRNSTEPADWSVGRDGAAIPRRRDMASRQEFGDCYLHVEFRIPTDAAGKQIGGGNSGVGLQGRYEVQILGDHGRAPNAHSGAALYSQKAATGNASRKPGEWQTYDIIFRAPRFGDDGQVTEKPRATVFQNGVLVQNNAEFTGMTGIQYDQYKEMAKTGPIVLQGDHDPVHFRNLWVVPL
jgi:hypothetical protein